MNRPFELLILLKHSFLEFGFFRLPLMNLPDKTAFKSATIALGDSYAKLLQEQQKLVDQCQKYKEKIEHYVNQIIQVTQDIQRLQDEYKSKGITFDEEPQFSQTYLIPKENIAHPLSVVYIAEIIDVTVICRTTYSPDGKLLAIGSNHSIRVYNIADWSPTFEFSLEEDQENQHIRALAWHPNKPVLISGCEDTKIRIFDINTKEILKEISTGHTVFDIKVSHNGEYFVAVTNTGPTLIYDTNSFEKIAELTASQPTDQQYSFCIAISDDDKVIACGYNNNKIIFWSYETKTAIYEQEIHDMDIYALCFYDNSHKLASGSLDKTIKLWEVGPNFQSLNLLQTIRNHTDFVLNLAIDKENQWMISGSKDKTIGITDLTTMEMVYTLSIHTNSVITVDFCPTQPQFCSGSGDQRIKIYAYSPDE